MGADRRAAIKAVVYDKLSAEERYREARQLAKVLGNLIVLTCTKPCTYRDEASIAPGSITELPEVSHQCYIFLPIPGALRLESKEGHKTRLLRCKLEAILDRVQGIDIDAVSAPDVGGKRKDRLLRPE